MTTDPNDSNWTTMKMEQSKRAPYVYKIQFPEFSYLKFVFCSEDKSTHLLNKFSLKETWDNPSEHC